MSDYHNSGQVGATTKKALKEAVRDRPETVRLYGTSMFDEFGPTAVTELQAGHYSVVGPEPQTSRKWYATVHVSESSTGKKLISVE